MKQRTLILCCDLTVYSQALLANKEFATNFSSKKRRV